MTSTDPVRVYSARKDAAYPPPPEAVLAEVGSMIELILHEYADGLPEITRDTRLGDDLELESIDLVTLSGLLTEWYGESVHLARFVAGLDPDAIIALTVGDLVDHIVARLAPAAGE
ncbi:acyl carrier protein [Streptomyces sp. NPDC047097]|uniref:acyl carrier protein n=1 Tax=Streptomyces sp. NPDC047097 TaxID=3155260 RepID=UPI0033EED2B4